jgi:ACS family hexuronate transporter-like MFS transporter
MAIGSLAMIGPGCVGLVDSPYTAIGLLCIGGFAHQTLSGALYSITSDVFGKNEVATATGLAGMSGYLGATLFTLLFGVLVTRVGYSPMFVVLAVLDVLAAIVVWVLVREGGPRPPLKVASSLETAQS